MQVMYTLEIVTDIQNESGFCLTDCGPSEGCNPDDWLFVDKWCKKGYINADQMVADITLFIYCGGRVWL